MTDVSNHESSLSEDLLKSAKRFIEHGGSFWILGHLLDGVLYYPPDRTLTDSVSLHGTWSSSSGLIRVLYDSQPRTLPVLLRFFRSFCVFRTLVPDDTEMTLDLAYMVLCGRITSQDYPSPEFTQTFSIPSEPV